MLPSFSISIEEKADGIWHYEVTEPKPGAATYPFQTGVALSKEDAWKLVVSWCLRDAKIIIKPFNSGYRR